MTDSFEISLPSFQGPLFQLHYLIKKEEINILDISISQITTLGLAQLEIKQFFTLGPELIYYSALFLAWKTRKLLPKEESLKSIEEEDFIVQFIQQNQFKEIVNDLAELEQKSLPHFQRNVSYVPEREEHSFEKLALNDLALLFQKIMEKWTPIEIEIEEEFDLSIKMDLLLKEIDKKKEVLFIEIFSLQKSKNELIVTFLALLELIKLQKISIHIETQVIKIKT